MNNQCDLFLELHYTLPNCSSNNAIEVNEFRLQLIVFHCCKCNYLKILNQLENRRFSHRLLFLLPSSSYQTALSRLHLLLALSPLISLNLFGFPLILCNKC